MIQSKARPHLGMPATAKSEQVKLRRISSLDGSDLYTNYDQKKKIRAQNSISKRNHNDGIKKYPPSRPYTTNGLKRGWARLRYFGALIRQRISGHDYPIIAIIVVNNHCNWDCIYCFGDYHQRRETDYTTDEIKHLVDELYDMGVRYLNLHGGETLLRSDIGELSNYIKNKGIYLCIITNGSLFPQKLDDVRNADNVTISLDGSRETNDINRGTGAFDVAIDAIELLRKEKVPVRVSATLTKASMHEVGFLAKLAHEKNFQLFFSILFKPLKKAEHLEMSNEDIRQVISEMRKYKAMGYPIFTSEPVLSAAYEWPFDFNDKFHSTLEDLPASYKKHHIPCYYSRTKFTIEADGFVYPCFLTTDGSFPPVNWKEVGIREAIRHVQNTNTCKACPAMSQNDHNLLLGLSGKQIKHVMKQQLFEALRIRKKISSARRAH
jgi:MoaA/NifB/PqqE/SkfB family radical SAM enzyme